MIQNVISRSNDVIVVINTKNHKYYSFVKHINHKQVIPLLNSFINEDARAFDIWHESNRGFFQNYLFLWYCFNFQYRRWCKAVDKGAYPTELLEFLKDNAEGSNWSWQTVMGSKSDRKFNGSRPTLKEIPQLHGISTDVVAILCH